MQEIAPPVNCIVVATDFSDNGNQAVFRAASLAKEKEKVLHLLHVVSPLEIYPELMVTFDTHVKDYERLKKANGLEELDQLAEKVRKKFGVSVSTKVSIGRAHTEITKFAKKQSADLIVVGFRGETNVIDAIMGSTASKLILTTPCAVLIVRDREVTSYRQVVAAVDLTEKSAYICSMACEIAPEAEIELLHVFDAQHEVFSKQLELGDDVNQYYDEATKHIAEKLDGLITNMSNSHVSSAAIDGYAPQVIDARTTEINADLLVLGKNSKTAVQEFLLGSVSRALIDLVHCDVLLT